MSRQARYITTGHFITVESIIKDIYDLVGLTVRKVLFDFEEKEWMILETNKGSVALLTEGDCCSHSWIYALTGVDNLVGQEILAVTNNYEVNAFDDDHDYIRVYTVDIKTRRGVFTIEFRNSSNGYYGGSIEVTNLLVDPTVYQSSDLENRDYLDGKYVN